MSRRSFCVAALFFLVGAFGVLGSGSAGAQPNSPEEQAHRAVAVFAGGCFWCMQPPFDKLDGVISTTAGYTGGSEADASYEKVSSGRTEHFESVQVVYDPTKVSYPKLVDVFWHNIDPYDGGGQFCDRGRQYRSAIFVRNEAERHAAQYSKQALEQGGPLRKPIATEILGAQGFYPAEDYHQDYYRKNPLKYRFYRATCGRDARLQELWGAATH